MVDKYLERRFIRQAKKTLKQHHIRTLHYKWGKSLFIIKWWKRKSIDGCSMTFINLADAYEYVLDKY